MTQKVVCCQSG